MKNLKLLMLVTLLIAAIAVITARGKVGMAHAEKLDVAQTTTGPESRARQAAIEKLQALSRQLADASPDQRMDIARSECEALGFHFLEPNSVEGRRLINIAVAKRIVQIYASDLPAEEKREQAQAWASDAGAQFHVERSPGEYQLPQDTQPPEVFKKLNRRQVRVMDAGECEGYCANLTILQSGCVVSCQEFLYSETTLVCGGAYYNFGPSNEICPCAS